MFILVLILIVACIPLMYGFGISYLIEAEIDKQVVANPQLKLVSKDFSKGYLKTKYNVEYTYTHKTKKDPKPTNIKVNISGGWVNAPDIMSLMDFVNNGFNPDSIILFKNEPEIKVIVPGKTPKDKLEFLIYGSLKVSSKLGMNLSFNLPKFFKEKGAVLFSLENMKLEAKSRWTFSDIAKIHEGRVTFEGASFSIDTVDLTTGNDKSDLKEFLIEAKGVDKGGIITAEFNTSLKSLNAFKRKVKNIKLNLFFGDFKVSGVEALNTWIVKNNNKIAAANIEIRQKKMKFFEHPTYAPLKKIIDQLFSKKISTGIKSFKGSFDGEKFDVKLTSSMPFESIDKFNPQMTMLSAKTQLKIKTPISMLTSSLVPIIGQKMYASVAQTNPGVSLDQVRQMARVQVQSIIENLIKNNVVIKKDKNIKTDIVFEKGQLKVNGNPSNPAILMSLFTPKGVPTIPAAQAGAPQAAAKPAQQQNTPNQDPQGLWMNDHKVFIGEWRLSFSDKVSINIFEHENRVYADCMGAKELIKQNKNEFEINCGQNKQVVIPLNQAVFKVKGTEKLIYRKP